MSIEREEEQYRKRVGAILWKEGHIAADLQRAGFEVEVYNGLTFVHFNDPKHFSTRQACIAKLLAYQKALSKHGIHLGFYDDSPGPYLCG